MREEKEELGSAVSTGSRSTGTQFPRVFGRSHASRFRPRPPAAPGRCYSVAHSSVVARPQRPGRTPSSQSIALSSSEMLMGPSAIIIANRSGYELGCKTEATKYIWLLPEAASLNRRIAADPTKDRSQLGPRLRISDFPLTHAPWLVI